MKHYRYRVFDWLGMCLQGRCDNQEVEPSRNIFVAMAHVYINTSYVTQFVDYLRYMDLEPDQGRWNTPEFIKKIQQWNADDLKIMVQEKRD